jgi:hypothetical protein
VIAVKEMEWICGICKPVVLPVEKTTDNNIAANATKFEEKETPILRVTLKPKVGAERFSTEERQSYFSRLSHTSLVKLLMDISSSNPNLPIFPSNLSQPVIPCSSFYTSAPKIPTPIISITAAPAVGPSTTTATNATKNSNLPATVITAAAATDNDSDSEYEYVEEHRLYPRAGNGFRLPPESEDLDMLLEDPQCSTFSHALHGPAKARAEAAGLASVTAGA